MPLLSFRVCTVFAWAILVSGLCLGAPKNGDVRVAETFLQATLKPELLDREFYLLRVEQYDGREWQDLGGRAGLYFFDAAEENKTAHQLRITELSTSNGEKVHKYQYVESLSYAPARWLENLGALTIDRRGQSPFAEKRTPFGGVSFRLVKKKWEGINFVPAQNIPQPVSLWEQKDPKRFFLIETDRFAPSWDRVAIFESDRKKSQPVQLLQSVERADTYDYTVLTQDGLRILRIPRTLHTDTRSFGEIDDPAANKNLVLTSLDARPDVLTTVGFKDIQRYVYKQPGAETCSLLLYNLVRVL